VWRFCMGAQGGRLTAENAVFRPGQSAVFDAALDGGPVAAAALTAPAAMAAARLNDRHL
jgi:hypothetical protein